MHCRVLTRADIPEAADIWCTASYNNPQRAYRYPYRGQYPLAWQREGVKRINDMLLDPNKYGFVSVADATDARAFHDSAGLPVMEGTVLGYSYWARRGESSEDAWMNCRATSNALERTLRRVEDLYEQYVYPNPAESAKNLELLRGTVGNESYRAKLKGVPHWHLLTIAVRSEFQRRGVGKQLLEWGLDPSAQDRTWSVLCPGLSTSPESGDPQIVSLSTTEEGRRLYEKAGFRVICNELGEPEASANVPGTTPFYSMVWDPSGHWTEEVNLNPSDGTGRSAGFVKWKVPGMPGK